MIHRNRTDLQIHFMASKIDAMLLSLSEGSKHCFWQDLLFSVEQTYLMFLLSNETMRKSNVVTAIIKIFYRLAIVKNLSTSDNGKQKSSASKVTNEMENRQNIRSLLV